MTRPNKLPTSERQSTGFLLKGEERRQESRDMLSAIENPQELGPLQAEEGAEIYSQKQQRSDNDLQRAKMKGRTRMPGAKQPTLQFNKGGMVHCRDYPKKRGK